MLNAVVGTVAGAVKFTGGVAGWAQYAYFRTQDRLEAEGIRLRDRQLEAAKSANNGLTFLKNERILDILWSTGQTNSLMEDCVRIAHLGKVAAERSPAHDSPDEEFRVLIEQRVATYADVTTRVAELSDIEKALGTGCSRKVGAFRLLAFRRGWASGKSAHEMYENDKHVSIPH
jgi:hypothetical protein